MQLVIVSPALSDTRKHHDLIHTLDTWYSFELQDLLYVVVWWNIAEFSDSGITIAYIEPRHQSNLQFSLRSFKTVSSITVVSLTCWESSFANAAGYLKFSLIFFSLFSNFFS